MVRRAIVLIVLEYYDETVKNRVNKIRKHRIDLFSLENPPDRFLLLDEVCNILAAKGLDSANLFKSLLKTCDGELTFNFGNTLIILEHTTALDVHYKKGKEDFTPIDIIEISISANSDLTEKILTYTYHPSELANLINLACQKTKDPTAQKQKKNKKVHNKTKSTIAKNSLTQKEKNHKLTGES